ncbi:MAG TPA: hypothetical protein VH413_16335 [Verrucomicrobiae bacterium]|jgi:hypothetical protein|nr:hypothetical protein [Verrucomicrobiae bacterium]
MKNKFLVGWCVLFMAATALANPFGTLSIDSSGNLINRTFFPQNLWPTNCVPNGAVYTSGAYTPTLVTGALYYFQSSPTDQGSLHNGSAVYPFPTNLTFVAAAGAFIHTTQSVTLVSSTLTGQLWTNVGLFNGDFVGRFIGDGSGMTNSAALMGGDATGMSTSMVLNNSSTARGHLGLGTIATLNTNGALAFSNLLNQIAGIFNGNGGGITNLQTSQLEGKIASANLDSNLVFVIDSRGNYNFTTFGGLNIQGDGTIGGDASSLNILNGSFFTVDPISSMTVLGLAEFYAPFAMYLTVSNGALFKGGVTNNSILGFVGNGGNLTNVTATNLSGTLENVTGHDLNLSATILNGGLTLTLDGNPSSKAAFKLTGPAVNTFFDNNGSLQFFDGGGVNIQGTGNFTGNGSGITNLNVNMAFPIGSIIPSQFLGSGGTSTSFLRKDGVYATLSGSGTVTSLGIQGDGALIATAPTGSPVTTAGTIILQAANSPANKVVAGPTSGGPAPLTQRFLVDADLAATDAALVIAAQTWAGAQQFTNNNNSFVGNGAGVTNISAGGGSFGTVTAHDSVTNFWLDFGGAGNPSAIAYPKIFASGDINFTTPTNGPGAVAYKILPNGANRNISWPTNFLTLNTNGLTLAGTNWVMTLTNGIRVAWCTFVADGPNETGLLATNVTALCVISP